MNIILRKWVLSALAGFAIAATGLTSVASAEDLIELELGYLTKYYAEGLVAIDGPTMGIGAELTVPNTPLYLGIEIHDSAGNDDLNQDLIEYEPFIGMAFDFSGYELDIGVTYIYEETVSIPTIGQPSQRESEEGTELGIALATDSYAGFSFGIEYLVDLSSSGKYYGLGAHYGYEIFSSENSGLELGVGLIGGFDHGFIGFEGVASNVGFYHLDLVFAIEYRITQSFGVGAGLLYNIPYNNVAETEDNEFVFDLNLFWSF